MRWYQFEPSSCGYPPKILAEVLVDVTETLEDDRKFQAERLGTFPEYILTRDELLTSREGRRTLRNWEAKDDREFDAVVREAKTRGDEVAAESAAHWQSLTAIEREAQRRRVRSILEGMNIHPDEVEQIVNSDGGPSLRVVK